MDIASAKYVSCTTFRRDGTPVATPVWIAPLGDGRVGFTIDADSGKAKRLRNNPAVTLRPCDARGRVAANAPTVGGRAEVVTGAAHDEVWRAVRRKYWLLANALHVGGLLRRLVRRTGDAPTAVVVTLDLDVAA